MLLTSTFSAQAGTVFATASGSGFLWYRLRLTVAEMNYATRRMVELQAPWISGDSPLTPRQHSAATSQQEPAALPLPAAPMTCCRPQPDRCAAWPRGAPPGPAQIHTHQWHARLQSALIAAGARTTGRCRGGAPWPGTGS
jgi:hypothetical protein